MGFGFEAQRHFTPIHCRGIIHWDNPNPHHRWRYFIRYLETKEHWVDQFFGGRFAHFKVQMGATTSSRISGKGHHLTFGYRQFFGCRKKINTEGFEQVLIALHILIDLGGV
jgi:hypothetical protein